MTHYRQLLELFLPHSGKNPENTTQKPVGGLEGALACSTAGNLGYHAVQQKTLPSCRKQCLEG
jgi:hypothetical protein